MCIVIKSKRFKFKYSFWKDRVLIAEYPSVDRVLVTEDDQGNRETQEQREDGIKEISADVETQTRSGGDAELIEFVQLLSIIDMLSISNF